MRANLLAMAGVPFVVGREGRAQYNESLAGVTAGIMPGSGAKNNIDVPIDPWVVFNQTSSGLIPGRGWRVGRGGG